MTYTKLSDYDYHLPKELIAQYPQEPRDCSRLMIVHRKSGLIEHAHFEDLARYFRKEDQLIINNTKVLPARLLGRKSSGGQVELLLSKQVSSFSWEVLAKPARKIPLGTTVIIAPCFHAEVIADLDEGRKIVQFHTDQPLMEALQKYGSMPLPRYIRRGAASEKDPIWYQTVFAEKAGAVAAPTAGLHFSQNFLKRLETQGTKVIPVTLHVGLGTFKPVQVEDIRLHKIHSEWCQITPHAAELWNQARASRWQLSVGTTSCRVLESAVQADGMIQSGSFETSLFIYPGYAFRATQALLTNFHLPQSSLLMLVAAFAGYDLMREAYAQAIREKYRFFSYGDAMMII